MLSPGERDRPLPPAAAAGIDEAAGDQRRSDGVVGDGRDEGVVLVPEVGGQANAVTDHPVGRQRRQRRHAEGVRDDVTPRPAPGRPHRHGATFEGQRAHEHLRLEHWPRRPPRPCAPRQPVNLDAHGRRVARGKDRLRQHEADVPTRAYGTHGDGQELGGSVGVRAAAVAAGASPCRRRRQLREERRVAEHDVDLAARELAPQGVTLLEHDVATPDECLRGQPERPVVDVDPDERRHGPGDSQPLSSGNEEPPVAARRVEHREPLACCHRGERVEHHVVDQPVRRRVAAALLARLRRQHAPSVGCPECKRPPAGSSRSSVTPGPP